MLPDSDTKFPTRFIARTRCQTALSVPTFPVFVVLGTTSPPASRLLTFMVPRLSNGENIMPVPDEFTFTK
jgi:hypothetical protein